ncbi:spermatogenesis-associated protein 48 [Mastacembelus armatus]|uniref:spermatogenesis-associated protein 48 n=1 Tax=Mastacembelus armatus TaxID=205130 RepID=UPI000E45B7D6|nr:spermatogenesis-associated protein 48 [Mastacembelus armatus]
MTTVWDPFKPFSTELYVIRRLNSRLYWAGGGDRLEQAQADAAFARLHAPAEHVALAPSRHDVPLLDPCTGQLSAGAEADLGIKGRQKFIHLPHVASALWIPPGSRERPETAPSSICIDLSEDKAWNSRRIPDAVLRTRFSGSDSPVKVQPLSLRTSSTAALHSSSLPDKHTEPQDGFCPDLRLWMDNATAVQRYRYTSATQRSYKEVGWDTKLPRRLKAPETTPEKLADPVSERPSSRRYNSQPQLWQCIGAEWSRQQLRSRIDAKKPILFCSGCPRSGQIPLYTGTIGSENMDNIDNPGEDFHPLTLKRNVMPPYTPTSHRPTIPGYTGKAVYLTSAASSPECISRVFGESGRVVAGHVTPLSRMVTTTHPSNPFVRPAVRFSPTDTRGDIRQSR